MKYQTKHKYKLISYLKRNQDKHLTMVELQKGCKDIPVATLYRLVDSLIEEGAVRKYIIGPNSSCCFQYIGDGDLHHHFHLICEKCGKLIHLECGEVDHLLEHIKEDHGFSVDISKVNLYGLCEDCKKENNL